MWQLCLATPRLPHLCTLQPLQFWDLTMCPLGCQTEAINHGKGTAVGGGPLGLPKDWLVVRVREATA